MPARYSLFQQIGNEWVRITSKSYFHSTAQFVWFDVLADSLVNPMAKPKRLQKVRF